MSPILLCLSTVPPPCAGHRVLRRQRWRDGDFDALHRVCFLWTLSHFSSSFFMLIGLLSGFWFQPDPAQTLQAIRTQLLTLRFFFARFDFEMRKLVLGSGEQDLPRFLGFSPVRFLVAALCRLLYQLLTSAPLVARQVPVMVACNKRDVDLSYKLVAIKNKLETELCVLFFPVCTTVANAQSYSMDQFQWVDNVDTVFILDLDWWWAYNF